MIRTQLEFHGKIYEEIAFNWFLIGLAIGIFTPILIRLIVKRL